MSATSPVTATSSFSIIDNKATLSLSSKRNITRQDSFRTRALHAVISPQESDDFEDPDDESGATPVKMSLDLLDNTFEDDDGLAEENLLLNLRTDLLAIRIGGFEAEVMLDREEEEEGDSP